MKSTNREQPEIYRNSYNKKHGKCMKELRIMWKECLGLAALSNRYGQMSKTI